MYAWPAGAPAPDEPLTPVERAPLAAITASTQALLLTGTITAGADPARAAAPVTVLRTGSVALTQEPTRSPLGQRRARGHHIHLAVRELERDPAPPHRGWVRRSSHACTSTCAANLGSNARPSDIASQSEGRE